MATVELGGLRICFQIAGRFVWRIGPDRVCQLSAYKFYENDVAMRVWPIGAEFWVINPLALDNPGILPPAGRRKDGQYSTLSRSTALDSHKGD